MSSHSNNKTIIKNTGYLYIRMLFITLVSLYTSRITLEALGVDDYGVYMLVGGFVALFMAFANLMTSATQRFLNFAVGKDDVDYVSTVFSSSVMIHGIFAFLFVILAESIGLWFVNNKLYIPEGSRFSAQIVYQCAILTMALTITQVPYNAVIIANEKMSFYSIIGILEAILKLSFTFILLTVKSKTLIIYACLMLFSSLIIRAVYYNYVRHQFPEIKLKFRIDRNLFKEMFSFAGWSLMGTASYVSINQAIPIILNMFFGVVVNAAMGLANQVSGTINQFVSNFQTAFKPQIIKLYAQDKKDDMMNLVILSSKTSFFMMVIVIMPLFPILGSLLHIWLPVVPEYTMIFCKLILIYCLVDTLTIPIWTAIEATGRIKTYQLFVGVFFLSYIPISYLMLRLGLPAESILWLKILMSVIIHAGRILIIQNNIPEFSPRHYLVKVIAPIVISLTLPLVFVLKCEECLNHYVLSLITLALSLISIFMFGMSSNEKKAVKQIVQTKVLKR